MWSVTGIGFEARRDTKSRIDNIRRESATRDNHGFVWSCAASHDVLNFPPSRKFPTLSYFALAASFRHRPGRQETTNRRLVLPLYPPDSRGPQYTPRGRTNCGNENQKPAVRRLVPTPSSSVPVIVQAAGGMAVTAYP